MTLNQLTLILTLCMTILISGCDSIAGASSSSAIETPIRVTQVTSARPEDVLRDFVTAWDAQDYTAMYRLLASRSRELYPAQVFENRYTVAHTVIKFESVDYVLNELSLQGNTAILDYNVTIDSPTFGEIQDDHRLMRLIQEGGWKVAWSPMDIFDGLSSDARLQVDTRFPQRANIYDRNGKALVEENGSIVSLYAIQDDMNDVDDCIILLGEVTRLQITTLRSIFGDYNSDTRFQVAEIDSERYFQYQEQLESTCSIFNTEDALSKVLQYTSRRYYGHGIASHILGYIGRVPADQINVWEGRGYSETDIVGLSGVENLYERELAGRPERFLRIVEPGGTTIRELGGAIGTPPTSVSVTLDRDMQETTAQAISDAVNYATPNWGAITLGGGVVVMDIHTGEILALASYPSFDPHIFNPDTQYNSARFFEILNSDARNPLQNKVLAEQYTPGSVYKLITTLAAASSKTWTPDKIFSCELEWRGQERFGDALPVRYDWRILNGLEGAGDITMVQALTSSCNPFFWEMGALMFQRDPTLLNQYGQKLGLGRPTGLSGFGPEASGNLANPGVSTQAINNAIGQGDVSLTIIQMAQVVSMIANGGKRYQPYIVSHIGTEGSDNYQVVNEPRLLEEVVLDPSALDIVREGMCKVISDTDLGTAEFVFSNAPYTLCGKTGTAQTGGAPNGWFVAYTPAEDPQIAIVAMMANSREGSETAAPIVRRILDTYYNAPIEPFPNWWQGEYVPLPIQTEDFVNENS